MSKIEWTEETWNPITGCNPKSEGCYNCYAKRMHKRLRAMGQQKYQHGFFNVTFHPEELNRNFGKKQKMIFVNSMSDTFHKDVSGETIRKMLDFMGYNDQHIFQILTKRTNRLTDFYYSDNMWLGVTVEMAGYKSRIRDLKKADAKTKFLSCEPLLGDLGTLDLSGIDWVICGGESGPGARPMHPDWVRNIQRQCQEQNVPFFFKQWGEWLPFKHWYNDPKSSDYGLKEALKVWSWGNGEHVHKWSDESFDVSIKVGKKKAGCLLDGKEYKQFPEVIK